MIKLFSLKSDSPYFSPSGDEAKSGPNLVQGQTNLDESLASICRDWLSRENKRPHQLPDRLLKSALLCRCRIQVLVSACFLGRRKEWRILRILAAMSTSFSLNPAGSGQTWWSRSFEELGSDLTGFTALRQPISSIKSNAWLSSPLPPKPCLGGSGCVLYGSDARLASVVCHFLCIRSKHGPAKTITPARGGRFSGMRPHSAFSHPASSGRRLHFVASLCAPC